MLRVLSLVALVLAGVVPVSGHSHSLDRPPVFDFDRIVTMGDSLSDSGNAFLLTGDLVVPPFEPIPSAPYLIGRFRFSNGPVWIERLARRLGLPDSARPAFGWPGVYTNYAVGGTRARPAGPIDLKTQVDAFLDDFDGKAPSDALYVLWIGANDLQDALAALEEDPSGATSAGIIEEAIAATEQAIATLSAAGAETFLVVNLPNLAVTPAVRALEPAAQAAGQALSQGYNKGLEDLLSRLEGLLRPITIIRFDVFSLLNQASADPEAFGLRNGTDSCITPGVILGAICRKPNTFLFWDFIHPTRAAHHRLAREVLELLGPATVRWAPAGG